MPFLPIPLETKTDDPHSDWYQYNRQNEVLFRDWKDRAPISELLDYNLPNYDGLPKDVLEVLSNPFVTTATGLGLGSGLAYLLGAKPSTWGLAGGSLGLVTASAYDNLLRNLTLYKYEDEPKYK